jgi:hypothetical protein
MGNIAFVARCQAERIGEGVNDELRKLLALAAKDLQS